MMIFKKAIPRRTFLRGVGATLALPLLDGMVPAFASAADGTGKPAIRMGFVYVPNGIIMDKWTPAAEGKGFEMTPILEPLAPFRDRLLVLTGLDHKNAEALPGEASAGHARASASFLTGVHPRIMEGAEVELGTSVDQIAAKELGKQTQLGSLELALEPTDLVGACDTNYSCAYTNTLCWHNATTPMPMESSPRTVFERLFGDSDTSDPAERLSRIQKDRSLLDSLVGDVARFEAKLGAADRAKLDGYLESIRDVERRIQRAEEQASREVPTLERPIGTPATFEEHAKLMFDFQVLAYQCDLTRVTTIMMAKESSGRAYPEIGIPDPHHPLTHHQGDAEKIGKVVKINSYHIKTFAYFLEKLRSIPDGDGNLLDHSVILYGGGLSDGNKHTHTNLPVLMVGGGAGRIKQGSHHRYTTGTPMPNLYLTLLDMVGVPVESLGNSTGKLELLSV
jgi:hypothetical protein